MAVKLIILVHTEEAFPWDQPFSRDHRSVGHVPSLRRYQELFSRYDASVGYALSYPVLEDSESIKFFQDIGRYHDNIFYGLHCHPWVTPPYTEEVNSYNSYPGNLPKDLEKEKIRNLYQRISKTLGRNPQFYLAGRYGIGQNTYSILSDLNITLDFSPVPYYDYSDQDGPDFSNVSNEIQNREGVTVIPHSAGFTGWLSKAGEKPAILKNSFLVKSRISSLLSLLGGFSQIILTPEGFSLGEMKALTLKLAGAGDGTLVLSFHSPSVVVGNTPFTQSVDDELALYDKLNKYLDFYVGEVKGEFFKPCVE